MIRAFEETYRTIIEWAEAEIVELHKSLENPRQTEVQTAIRRGEIARLRKLLSMMKEDPPNV